MDNLINNLKLKLGFLFLIIFSALLLSACGKHDKPMFRVTYVCTNDRVCSLTLVPLDAVYEQDLITDQFLYSKPYPNGYVKTTIRWFANSQSKAALASEKELDERNLISCTNNQCTLNSNPTGLRFDGNATHAIVHVKGEASINNIIYPVNLSTKIKFNNLGAPTIATDGVCSSVHSKCRFEVTKDPKGGYSPFYYKWLLNNKQIAQTRSDDSNKGKLDYTFKSFSNDMVLQMVAVDKNGDQSPPSNKLKLSTSGGLHLTVEGETNVATSSEYTYDAINSSSEHVYKASSDKPSNNFIWTLPSGWSIKKGTPAHAQVVTVETSKNVLPSASIKVSEKGVGTGSLHITMYDSSQGPTGGEVDPTSGSVKAGSTVIYNAKNFTVGGGSASSRLLNIMEGDISGTVDQDGYRWIIKQPYQDDFRLGNSTTANNAVTVLNPNLTSIPAGVIGVQASDIGKDKKRHYGKVVYSKDPVAIKGSDLKRGRIAVPVPATVPFGGIVTLTAEDFEPQKDVDPKGYQWKVVPLYADDFSIVDPKNTSNTVKIQLEKNASRFSEIPIDSIGVVAHDVKGNPSKIVLLDEPIKIIKNPPVVLIKYDSTGGKGDGSVVEGNTLTITADIIKPGSGGAPYSYDWSGVKSGFTGWTVDSGGGSHDPTITLKAPKYATGFGVNKYNANMTVSDSLAVSSDPESVTGTVVAESTSKPKFTLSYKSASGKTDGSVVEGKKLTIAVNLGTPGHGAPYTFDWDGVKSRFTGWTLVSGGGAHDPTITLKAPKYATGFGVSKYNANMTISDSASVSSDPVSVTGTVIAESTSKPEFTLSYESASGRTDGSVAEGKKLTIAVNLSTPGYGGPYTFDWSKVMSGFTGWTFVSGGGAHDATITLKAPKYATGSKGNIYKSTVTVTDVASIESDPVMATATVKAVPKITVVQDPATGIIPYDAGSSSQILTYTASGAGTGGSYSWTVPATVSNAKGISVTGKDTATLTLTINDKEIALGGLSIAEGAITVIGTDSDGIASQADAPAARINGSKGGPTGNVTVDKPILPYTGDDQEITYTANYALAKGTTGTLGYTWTVDKSKLPDGVSVKSSSMKDSVLVLAVDHSKVDATYESIKAGAISVVVQDNVGNKVTGSGPGVRINGSTGAPTGSVKVDKPTLLYTGDVQEVTYTAKYKLAKGAIGKLGYTWAVSNLPDGVSVDKSSSSMKGSVLVLDVDDSKVDTAGESIINGAVSVVAQDSLGNKVTGPGPEVKINGSSSAPSVSSIVLTSSKVVPYDGINSQEITYLATVNGGKEPYNYAIDSVGLIAKYGSELSDASVTNDGGGKATITLTVKPKAAAGEIDPSDIKLGVKGNDGNINYGVANTGVKITGSSAAPTGDVTVDKPILPYTGDDQEITYTANYALAKGTTGTLGYTWTVDKSKLPDGVSVKSSSMKDSVLVLAVDHSKVDATYESIKAGAISVVVQDNVGNKVTGSGPGVRINGSAGAPTGSVKVDKPTLLYTGDVQEVTYTAKYKLAKGAIGKLGYTWAVSNLPDGVSVDKSSSSMKGSVLVLDVDDSKVDTAGESIINGAVSVVAQDSLGNKVTGPGPEVKINGSSSAPDITITMTPASGKIPYDADNTSQKLEFKAQGAGVGGSYSWTVPATVSKAQGISVAGKDTATLTLTVNDKEIAPGGLSIAKGDITVIGTDATGNKSKVDAPAAAINGSSSTPTITVSMGIPTLVKTGILPFISGKSSQIVTFTASGEAGVTLSNFKWDVEKVKSLNGVSIKSKSGDKLVLDVDDTASGMDKPQTLSKGDISVTAEDADGDKGLGQAPKLTINGSSNLPEITYVVLSPTPPSALPYNDINPGKIKYGLATVKGTKPFSIVQIDTKGLDSNKDIVAHGGGTLPGSVVFTIKPDATAGKLLGADFGVYIQDGDGDEPGEIQSSENVTINGKANAPQGTIALKSATPVGNTGGSDKIEYKASYSPGKDQSGTLTYTWAENNLPASITFDHTSADGSEIYLNVAKNTDDSGYNFDPSNKLTVTVSDPAGNTITAHPSTVVHINGEEDGPTISMTPSTYTTTVGKSMTVTANVSKGKPPYTYSWSFHNVYPYGYPIDHYTLSPDNTTQTLYISSFPADDQYGIKQGNIKLYVTDSNGNQSKTISNPLIDIVTDVPQLRSITASSTSVSVGKYTTLTATGDNLPDGDHYTWTLPKGWKFEGSSPDKKAKQIVVGPNGTFPVSGEVKVEINYGDQTYGPVSKSIYVALTPPTIGKPTCTGLNCTVKLSTLAAGGSGSFNYTAVINTSGSHVSAIANQSYSSDTQTITFTTNGDGAGWPQTLRVKATDATTPADYADSDTSDPFTPGPINPPGLTAGSCTGMSCNVTITAATGGSTHGFTYAIYDKADTSTPIKANITDISSPITLDFAGESVGNHTVYAVAEDNTSSAISNHSPDATVTPSVEPVIRPSISSVICTPASSNKFTCTTTLTPASGGTGEGFDYTISDSSTITGHNDPKPSILTTIPAKTSDPLSVRFTVSDKTAGWEQQVKFTAKDKGDTSKSRDSNTKEYTPGPINPPGLTAGSCTGMSCNVTITAATGGSTNGFTYAIYDKADTSKPIKASITDISSPITLDFAGESDGNHTVYAVAEDNTSSAISNHSPDATVTPSAEPVIRPSISSVICTPASSNKFTCTTTLTPASGGTGEGFDYTISDSSTITGHNDPKPSILTTIPAKTSDPLSVRFTVSDETAGWEQQVKFTATDKGDTTKSKDSSKENYRPGPITAPSLTVPDCSTNNMKCTATFTKASGGSSRGFSYDVAVTDTTAGKDARISVSPEISDSNDGRSITFDFSGNKSGDSYKLVLTATDSKSQATAKTNSNFKPTEPAPPTPLQLTSAEFIWAGPPNVGINQYQVNVQDSNIAVVKLYYGYGSSAPSLARPIRGSTHNVSSKGSHWFAADSADVFNGSHVSSCNGMHDYPGSSYTIEAKGYSSSGKEIAHTTLYWFSAGTALYSEIPNTQSGRGSLTVDQC
ncbi:immunoglobulin domain-containing protein [Francisella sp. SYW-9]|uniref:immunoglobulin domain-containing protein n=1 Tax=Francisella sp. SYW-9 TaxID=2610888 RepID=UPI00123DABD7|nr:immunoglobulin domain-containing protein [Francisella sp. SYW-9]